MSAERSAATTPTPESDAATLDERTSKAVTLNARHMKQREYEWLKAQEFQPLIRRALVEEYERLHPG